MIYYFFIILLSEIFLVQCNHTKEEEDCVVSQLEECNNKFKVNLHFYPSDINELRQHCRTIEQKEECLNNIRTECMEEGPLKQNFPQFSSEHYKDLCNYNSSYSRLFVMHGKCLNQTVSKQKRCHLKYRVLSQTRDEVLKAVGYSRINNTREVNIQKIRQLCCWWSEYQTCVMKPARDQCGEQSGLLVGEQFSKSHTSTSTSRIITYKSCIPVDNRIRFPACFLEQSIDPPKPDGTSTDNDHELDVEDSSRKKVIIGMFESNIPKDSTEANYIKAPNSPNGANKNMIKDIYIATLILKMLFT